MESIHHWKAWNTGQSALFKQKRPNIKWEKWSCGLKQRDSLLKFFKTPSDLVIKYFISFEGGFTSFSLEVSTVMGWSCVFYNLHMQLLCAVGSHQEPVSGWHCLRLKSQAQQKEKGGRKKSFTSPSFSSLSLSILTEINFYRKGIALFAKKSSRIYWSLRKISLSRIRKIYNRYGKTKQSLGIFTRPKQD